METLLTASLLPAMAELLLLADKKVTQEAPTIIQGEAGPILSSPDRRMSSGIYFPDGDPRPAIFVAEKGTWAETKADELADELSADVNVIARGRAHSVWPTEPVEVRDKKLPLRPGDSVSNYRSRAGTLGCLVTLAEGPTILRGFISASHVLAIMNKARAGDDDEDADPIIRPGYPDGPSTAANRVGYLRN